MTLVIIMKFRIARGREGEWEHFVRERSGVHSGAPGYQRMYLLRPQSESLEYRVVSWWDEIDKPLAWIRKEAYEYSESQDHAGIVIGPVDHEILSIVQEY